MQKPALPPKNKNRQSGEKRRALDKLSGDTCVTFAHTEPACPP